MTITQIRKEIGEDNAMVAMDEGNRRMRAVLQARVENDV